MTDKILNQIRAALLYTSINSGRKVVATHGTAVALATDTACKEVTITAEVDNTQEVTFGGTTVVGAVLTRIGTPLEPGVSKTIRIDNLSKVWIDSIVNGEGVTYNYYT